MSEQTRIFQGTTVADAAAITGLSEPTIYRAIKSGDLRAKKVGRRTIIMPQWVEQWLERMPDTKEGMV